MPWSPRSRPPGKKNLCNAITYSGVPIGSLLAALLAILLLDSIGWRGMFLIGALPIVTLLPLAFFKMPESVAWLVARGQIDKARAISERTGVPLPEAPTAAQEAAKREKVGFAGLFSRGYWLPTVLLGFMSATGLMLVYSLNTWLPVLMERAGFNAKGSLSFLLVLNGGAIVGALVGSRFADRFGPKPVVAACFLIGAVVDRAAHLEPAAGPAAGVRRDRRSGHQRHPDPDLRVRGQLLPDQMRGAGVAWCAGFGRLGGVAGPLLGGFLLAAGLAVNSIFYVLAGGRVWSARPDHAAGASARTGRQEIHSTPIEPSVPAASPTPGPPLPEVTCDNFHAGQ